MRSDMKITFMEKESDRMGKSDRGDSARSLSKDYDPQRFRKRI